jgi:hypothetical protein
LRGVLLSYGLPRILHGSWLAAWEKTLGLLVQLQTMSGMCGPNATEMAHHDDFCISWKLAFHPGFLLGVEHEFLIITLQGGLAKQ